MKAERVSIVEMGRFTVAAQVKDRASAINAAIALEYFKVTDCRPETLALYEELARPADHNSHVESKEDADAGDAAAASSYTASLQAFGTVVHLEGTETEPFLHLEAGVTMDPDDAGRVRALKVKGGLGHVHVTLSDIILQVATIFEPPQLPAVPDHVAALFSKSAEATVAATSAVAAETAAELLDDNFLTDVMRGVLQVCVCMCVCVCVCVCYSMRCCSRIGRRRTAR